MRLNTDEKQLLTGGEETGVLQSICDCSHTQISDKEYFIAYQRDVGCNESSSCFVGKNLQRGEITARVDDLYYSEKRLIVSSAEADMAILWRGILF